MAFEIMIKKKVFIIPESSDPCDLWRAYFTKLKQELGRENAKMIWLITWSKNGNITCTTNEDFNKFLKKNEIDVSSAATRAIADISTIGSNVLGLNKRITKVFSIAVPVSLAAILVFIIYLLYNVARKTDPKDLVMLYPGARAARGASGALKNLKL